LVAVITTTPGSIGVGCGAADEAGWDVGAGLEVVGGAEEVGRVDVGA
jgi:hypothetical protein